MPMNHIHLPDLIGRPETDPLVQSFIQQYHLVEYEKTADAREHHEANHSDTSYDEFLASIAKLGIRGTVHYVRDTPQWTIDLEVTNRATSDAHLSVDRVSLWRPGIAVLLPFGLTWDTDVSELSIGRLLDARTYLDDEKKKRHLKDFLLDDLNITIGYEEPGNLLTYFVLSSITERELCRVRFHDELKAQKSHLVPNVDAFIDQWRKDSPVHEWRKRMADGDLAFTEIALALSDAEIDTLHQSLRAAVAKRSPTQLVNAVKKTIKSFNRLTRKYNDFVETSEREELAPYLQNLLVDTGLKFEDGFDVTEEWREW